MNLFMPRGAGSGSAGQKILSLFGVKVSLVTTVVSLAVLSGVLFVMPRVLSVSHADVCNGATDGVDFNHFPITYVGEPCKDFPTVTLREQNGQYPSSQQEFSNGVQAGANDVIYVRVWVHNGAVTGGETANNVNININVPTQSGSGDFPISASISADNDHGRGASGSETIHADPGSSLQVVSGDVALFDDQGNPLNLPAGFQTSPTSFHFDSQDACFEFAKFIRIAVKVVPPTVITPPPAQTTGTISATANNNCPATVTLVWHTQNPQGIIVYDQNSRIVSGEWNSDGFTDTNVQDGQTYIYSIWSVDWGTNPPTQLSKVATSNSVTVHSNCAGPTPPSFTFTASNFCVGQQPSYSINGTANMVGFPIVWSSTFNGQPTGENNAYVGQTIAGNGGGASWSGVGSTWTTANIGHWTKTATINGVSQTQTFDVKDCSTPAPTPSVNSFTASFQCPSTGVINWSTSNGSNVHMYVRTDSNPEQDFANEESGNQTVNWIEPGHTYVFRLHVDGLTDRTQTVSPAANACGTPTQSSFTLTAANFCVGQQPSYSITGTADLVGKSIIWSSTLNGQPTGENNAYIGQTIAGNNGLATWSGTGYAWTTANIGHWTKTATINGVSQTQSFDVVNCNPVTPPAVLVCNPTIQTVNINQPATFTANGGSGSYTWSAPLSNTQSGSGASFSTSYASQNTNGYQVVVRDSAGQTAQCGVKVNPPQVSTLQCTPGTQNVTAGGTANFNAAGGNGSYTWTTTGNATTGNNQSNFSAAFGANGSATVRSGDGQQATCNVTVSAAPQQNFTVSAANFCVGQGTTYTFNGTQGLIGQQINAVSQFNNGSQTNIGSIGTFTSNGNLAYYIVTGHAWTSSEIGHWKFVFTSGGINQTAEFDVRDCNPVTPPALICNPNATQTVAINQSVYFNATGGSGSYTWNASGANQTSGSGVNFSTSYANSGNYSVSVSDGKTSAACNVHVNPPQYTQLQCMPPSQTANANQTVYFSATGGNGAYTWTAPNSSNQSGTGNNFTTSYGNNSGYQAVTVRSGDGQVATCNVQILTQQPPSLICSPASQTVNQGQTVYFSAFGGNGNYSWTATNGQSGNGSSFNIIFNNSGSQSATVRDGNGQTQTCYAYINPNIVNQNGYLLINKWVAHTNQNDFSSSITANSGDRVTYKIQVSAANGSVSNVNLSDYFSLSGNATYINGTLRVDGNTTGDNWSNMNLGTISQGQTKIVTFDAYVTAVQNQSQTQIVNTATASGNNTGSVSATATVIINGQVLSSNVNITLSKRAWNDTKNQDAQSINASKEDFITYTLTAANNGNSAATNFVITDDLSQVLPYADVVDNGGGSLSGNVVSYPARTIPAGGSVSVSFRVRVKYFLADNLSYTMTNTYGNTVTIHINTPQVLGAFIAPKTGADTLALGFGAAAMVMFGMYKKRKFLTQLILNN